METVFKKFSETDLKKLVGYTIADIFTGKPAEETGFVMELEKEVDKVTLGIDVTYTPEADGKPSEVLISGEYLKYIDSEVLDVLEMLKRE